MQSPEFRKTSKVVGAGILALVAVGGAYALSTQPEPESETTTQASATQATTTQSPQSTPTTELTATPAAQVQSPKSTATTAATATPQAKTEKYTNSTRFSVPKGGVNTLNTTLTVSGKTITDVSISVSESNRESTEYTRTFTNAIGKLVIGKTIDEGQEIFVTGASLTSAAFTRALSQISTQVP
jgi:cytoskeletal protein RodZ